jgi:hypothetical protein
LVTGAGGGHLVTGAGGGHLVTGAGGGHWGTAEGRVRLCLMMGVRVRVTFDVRRVRDRAPGRRKEEDWPGPLTSRCLIWGWKTLNRGKGRACVGVIMSVCDT